MHAAAIVFVFGFSGCETLASRASRSFAPVHFRTMARRITRHRLFEAAVLSAILVSCTLLALAGSPFEQEHQSWLRLLDLGITVAFTVEAVLLLVANGAFASSDEPYFRQWYNLLDFTVLIVSWLEALGPSSGSGNSAVGSVRSARALRALKPLRTVKYFPALRTSVETLLACLPVFVNIFLCNLFVLTLFALIALTLYAGLFWSCNDPTVTGVSECVGNFTSPSGTMTARKWSNAVRLRLSAPAHPPSLSQADS